MTTNGDGLTNAGISPRERLERIEKMLERIDDKLDSKADVARLIVVEQFVQAQVAQMPHYERMIGEFREAQREIATLKGEAARTADVRSVAHEVEKVQRKLAYYAGGLAVLTFGLNLFREQIGQVIP